MAQLTTANDEDSHIHFLCGILVTTSELYVLKPNLAISQFFDAPDLESVSDKVDALIAYQELGPQLSSHCKRAIDLVREEYPALDTRIGEVGNVQDPDKKRIVRPGEMTYEHFYNACSRLIVVNLESLDWFLGVLRDRIYQAGTSRRKVMTIAMNREDLSRHFMPL